MQTTHGAFTKVFLKPFRSAILGLSFTTAGKTWPMKRLVNDGKERHLDGGAWTGFFDMDATHAEPRGYLAGTQSPDGMIHILSSRMHYRFNLKWIEQKK